MTEEKNDSRTGESRAKAWSTRNLRFIALGVGITVVLFFLASAASTQIVRAGDGRAIWIVNKLTGNVALCTPKECRDVD